MRRRLARVAPAACLVVVAALQITLAKTRDLTPWKGGGFGMFSTSDQPRVRFTRVFLRTRDGDELLAQVGRQPSETALRAASWPVESAAADLARETLAIARRTRRDLVGARVEIWKRDFESATRVMRPRRIAEFRFDG